MNLIEKIHTLTQSQQFFVRSTCSLPRYTGVGCPVSINTVKEVCTRELNALKIGKNICKLRKQLHQFDNTRCKCSQHKQIKKHAANTILYLFALWAFAAPAVKLMKMCSWFAGAFSIACVFWSCSVLSSLSHRRFVLVV